MPAFTVRYRPAAGAEQRSSLEDRAHASGGTVTWTHSDEYDRSYALVEGTSAPLDISGATVFETPLIALAIRPNAAEALPLLEHALGGPGRPAGMESVERADGALIVEWNLDVTPAGTVLAIVDVELARFHASRVTALLTPLPLAWWTAIAREGLAAPEIAPDRVLEALIEKHHVVS